MRQLMNILWPSFIAAGVAEVLLFTFIDPADFGASRRTVYTAGFFALWLLGACSSALTCFFQRGAREINPKREAS